MVSGAVGSVLMDILFSLCLGWVPNISSRNIVIGSVPLNPDPRIGKTSSLGWSAGHHALDIFPVRGASRPSWGLDGPGLLRLLAHNEVTAPSGRRWPATRGLSAKRRPPPVLGNPHPAC